tara:strand:- start:1704 stop:2732 length:1029 start_codon:yes stop_codon:yes gene_type:complete
MATQKLYEELKTMDIGCGNFELNNENSIVFKFKDIKKGFDSLLIFEEEGTFKIRLSYLGVFLPYSSEYYGYDKVKKVNLNSASEIANEIVRIFHLYLSLNCNDMIHCAFSKHDTEVTLFLHRATRKHTSFKDIGGIPEEYKNAADDPDFIKSPLGKNITKQIRNGFIDEHKMLWMGWSQEAKSWFAIDCLKLWPEAQRKLKEEPCWKDMGESIKITKIVITNMKSNEISKKWGKALIGNSRLKDYPYLNPCSTVPARGGGEICGAPTEFVVKYNEDGEAIFNPNPRGDFLRFLAEQLATEICDVMLEESEEEEEEEEQIVLEPISTSVVGDIPVATQVELIN